MHSRICSRSFDCDFVHAGVIKSGERPIYVVDRNPLTAFGLKGQMWEAEINTVTHDCNHMEVRNENRWIK